MATCPDFHRCLGSFGLPRRIKRSDGAPILGDGTRGRSRPPAPARLRAHASGRPCGGSAASVDSRAPETADGICGRRASRCRSARKHLAGGVCRASRGRYRGTIRCGRQRLFSGHLADQRHRRGGIWRALVCRHAPCVLSPRPLGRGGIFRSADHLAAMGRDAQRAQETQWSGTLRHSATAQRVRAAVGAGATAR